MKIIVGLGNPGKEYEQTRHNLGWLAADALCLGWNFENWKHEKNLDAELSGGKISGEKVVLAKPQTYMNRSGEAVKKILGRFRAKPGDLILIHDDLDLPWGAARPAFGRGSAGHKGVRSVIDSLGTKDFSRVRLGIGRPEAGTAAEDYVLGRLSKHERSELPQMLELASGAVEKLISKK